jgi:hypothetical protein
LWGFVAGSAAVALAGIAALAWQNAWPAILQQVAWNREHYSGSNRVMYGDRVGGWGLFFGNVASPDWVIRASIGLALLSPVVLPVVVSMKWRRVPAMWLAAGWALVASTLPRADSAHLLYISPVFFAMAAILVDEIRQRSIQTSLRIGLGFAFVAVAMFMALDVLHTYPVATAAGRVRAPQFERDLLKFVGAEVRPGSSLFVYPYKPILYFLTGTTNPARYSYLQPGMMDEGDEARVLEDLAKNPPEHVLIQELHAEQILRVWPNTDTSRLRYPKLESFFESEYRVIGSLPPPSGGTSWIRLLRHRDYSSIANSSPLETIRGR